MTSRSPLILYGFSKLKDHPSPSPFCQKLETFFRVAAIPYKSQRSLPSKGPKGKLPYIYIDGKVVADSHFIVQELVSKGIAPDLDAKLTPAQKADSRCYQAYIEEFLHFCLLKERWLEDTNYNIMYKENFGRIYWPLNWIMASWYRTSIRRNLWGQGISRHSDEEIESINDRIWIDLENKYSHGKPYFHETEEPTLIDIILYSYIANILSTDTNPRNVKYILAKPYLVQFAKIMTQKIFPEYHRIIAKLEGGASLPLDVQQKNRPKVDLVSSL